MDLQKNCAKDRLILALDVDTIEEAQELVYELKDYVGIFKVGINYLQA
jgi:orotidine-5'-phosphate decarboxylase